MFSRSAGFDGTYRQLFKDVAAAPALPLYHITYNNMHRKCSKLPITVNTWKAVCA